MRFRLQLAAAVLWATVFAGTPHADVIRLTDGTTHTGLLLERTTTGVVFERMETLHVPEDQLAFVDETGTTGSDLQLIPLPKQVKQVGANLKLGSVWFDTADEAKREGTRRPREYFEHALRSMGVKVVSRFDDASSPTQIHLTAVHRQVRAHDADPNSETYTLLVSPGDIFVIGASPQGERNGVQTLLQLITGDAAHGFEIRQVNIEDWPSTSRRICHLPRLTHKSDLDLFRRYARLLARYKFNTLIVENSGAIKLDKHPEAWWSDGFSKEEIRSLIADFKELGFEVIPQLNSFGHVDEWLGTEPGDMQKYNMADLFSNAEYHDTLNPCNPRVYEILDDCYMEMLDVYGQPRFFHVGLDEARRRGFGANVDCRGKPPHEIFAEHANRIGEFFAKRNITPIMWGDLLLDPARFPGIDNCNGGPPTNFAKTLDLIKQPYVLMDWHYDAPDPLPTLKYLAGKGHEVWATPWKDPRNTYGHARAALQLGLQGVCATTWNFFDRGGEYMREVDILAAPILVAQYAWNPDAPAPSTPAAWSEREVFLRAWPGTAAKW